LEWLAAWQVVEEVAAEAQAEAQVAELKSLGRTLEKALSLAGVAVEKSEWVWLLLLLLFYVSKSSARYLFINQSS
jgi:hypothetical protein